MYDSTYSFSFTSEWIQTRISLLFICGPNLPNKVSVRNKTEDLNLTVFNIITEINVNVDLMRRNVTQIDG